MAWIQLLVTFLGMVLGSGLIQFLITRKDSKEEEIKKIQEDFAKELKSKEKVNEERFLTHQKEIENFNKIILQLSENDTKQSQYLKYIGDEITGLAHDKLVCLTDKYQERGAITLKEKATLRAIYQPYHEGLGGNGDGQAGYEFCMKLPVVTNEQAKTLDNKIQNNL